MNRLTWSGYTITTSLKRIGSTRTLTSLETRRSSRAFSLLILDKTRRISRMSSRGSWLHSFADKLDLEFREVSFKANVISERSITGYNQKTCWYNILSCLSWGLVRDWVLVQALGGCLTSSPALNTILTFSHQSSRTPTKTHLQVNSWSAYLDFWLRDENKTLRSRGKVSLCFTHWQTSSLRRVTLQGKIHGCSSDHQAWT